MRGYAAGDQTDGYLDGFLENYHNALNVPNYGREDRPQNTFGYVIGKDGDIWISGETTGWALADSTITVAYAWPDPSSAHTLTGQLLGRVKLPMGDPDLGLGSGHYDVGLYWAAAWQFERWSYYLMPGLAWISDPDTQGADISARNCLSLFGFVFIFLRLPCTITPEYSMQP